MIHQRSSPVLLRHLCSVFCSLLALHSANAETLLEAGSRCEVLDATCREGLVCVPETPRSTVKICRGKKSCRKPTLHVTYRSNPMQIRAAIQSNVLVYGVVPTCSTCLRVNAARCALPSPPSTLQPPLPAPPDAQRTESTTRRERPGRETAAPPAPARPEFHYVPPSSVTYRTTACN